MGDMAEDFNALKQRSKDKRASNRCQSAGILDLNKIHYTTNNGGAHLIVEGNVGFIDFWPGTGRWKCRTGLSGFGVFNLVTYIKGDI